MQSRKQSLFEVFANVFTGWLVAFALQLLIFPKFGIHIPISTNIQISAIFTVAAVVRGYFFRRAFNRFTIRHHSNLTAKQSP